MKKIIVLLFISIICINTIGCSDLVHNNTKAVVNVIEKEEKIIYGEKEVETIKNNLKDYDKTEDLKIHKAIKKGMVVIDDKEIVGNKKTWNNFYNNSKEGKEDSIIIVKYTEQGDPIVSYLSYCDNEYFMVEDNTRDKYNEDDDAYYEYKFKYLILFEDYNYEYAYLLDDKNVTLDELNYSLSSQNPSDWIKYGFIFYINK